MTTRERQTCDCPEQPCTCYKDGYSAGQYQALADYIESIEGDSPHTKRCRCATCYIRQTWDEIQKTGTDPETIARKMVKFTKGLKRFSGVTIVFMPTTRGRARARCSRTAPNPVSHGPGGSARPARRWPARPALQAKARAPGRR